MPLSKTSIPLIFTALVCLASCNRTGVEKRATPNIVIFLTDDQGWGDLSIHGNTNLHRELSLAVERWKNTVLSECIVSVHSSPAALSSSPAAPRGEKVMDFGNLVLRRKDIHQSRSSNIIIAQKPRVIHLIDIGKHPHMPEIDKKDPDDTRVPVGRFRTAIQNDFAARMLWTVHPDYLDANHPPVQSFIINQAGISFTFLQLLERKCILQPGDQEILTMTASLFNGGDMPRQTAMTGTFTFIMQPVRMPIFWFQMLRARISI